MLECFIRKIFAFLVASLDGYHETSSGELFWHNVDSEFLEFAAAQLDEADTLPFASGNVLLTYQSSR
jgi:hypothetical protein